MALKILEAHVPSELAPEAEALLREVSEQTWTEEGGRFGTVVRAVVPGQKSGGAVDSLHEQLSNRGRMMVLVEPLDAVIPQPAKVDHPGRHEPVHSASCLLYTSPSPRDQRGSRMPSSA